MIILENTKSRKVSWASRGLTKRASRPACPVVLPLIMSWPEMPHCLQSRTFFMHFLCISRGFVVALVAVVMLYDKFIKNANWPLQINVCMLPPPSYLPVSPSAPVSLTLMCSCSPSYSRLPSLSRARFGNDLCRYKEHFFLLPLLLQLFLLLLLFLFVCRLAPSSGQRRLSTHRNNTVCVDRAASISVSASSCFFFVAFLLKAYKKVYSNCMPGIFCADFALFRLYTTNTYEWYVTHTHTHKCTTLFLFESWSVVHECHTHTHVCELQESEKAEEEGERALDKQKLQKQFNYFHILITLTSTSLKYVINIIDLLNQFKLIVKVFVYSKSFNYI